MLRAAVGRSAHRLSLPLGTVAARLFAAEAAPVEHESFEHILGSQLSSMEAAGTYKQEFEITSAQGPSICEHTLKQPAPHPVEAARMQLETSLMS